MFTGLGVDWACNCLDLFNWSQYLHSQNQKWTVVYAEVFTNILYTIFIIMNKQNNSEDLWDYFFLVLWLILQVLKLSKVKSSSMRKPIACETWMKHSVSPIVIFGCKALGCLLAEVTYNHCKLFSARWWERKIYVVLLSLTKNSNKRQ